MSWVKLDDHANEHAKQVDAGGEACWLWACGLMYCNRQKKRTGLIPAAQVKGLYVRFMPAQAERLARELVRVGLWLKIEGGYAIHDYHDFQPSSDVSAARSEAGRRGGMRSGETRKNESKCVDQTKQVASFCFKQLASSNEEVASDALLPLAEANPSRTRADARRAGSGIGSDPDPEGSAEGGLPDRRAHDSPMRDQPASESHHDVAERVWSELWQAKYREPYRFSPAFGPQGDDVHLRELGRWAAELLPDDPERCARHIVAAYLKDPGDKGKLTDERHPLAWLVKFRLNKYGSPPKLRAVPPASATLRASELVEVPLTHEQRAERARAAIAAMTGRRQ